MASNVKQFKLTAEGLKQREEELEYLKSVKRKDIADKIKVALSFDGFEKFQFFQKRTGTGREPHSRTGDYAQERRNHR